MTLAQRIDPLPEETGHAAPSACPACVAAPSAEQLARMAAPADARLMLSVPMAHCAVCISTVEQALADVPGVRSARMNLTLKRVSVEAEPEIDATPLIAALKGAGYEAQYAAAINSATLRAAAAQFAG